MNLHRQFAGGRDDDRPGTDRIFSDRRFHQMMQRRQQKRGGFAGAGLGLPSDVLAFERRRQGGRLNRGAMGKAGVLDAFQQRIVQAERSKRDGSEMIFLHELAMIPGEQGFGDLRERPVWAEMHQA